MVVAWFVSPFFRTVHPGPIPEAMRKAIQLKLLVIGCYIATMFLMALSLVLLAWLDIRETRLKGLKAQVEMWKDVSERSRDRHGKPSNQ